MVKEESEESLKEIEKILKKETIGFLGLSMNGEPYVVPMTYGYHDGKIFFHCSLEGKKLDYMRSNPSVCFTVGWQSGRIIRHPQGARCKANHDSVICYGTARIIEDIDERCEALNIFNRCLQPGAKEITPEEVINCLAVEIKINRMTGRQQRNGGERTFWEYNFK
jgi:nitroimidazol reductase NimA-like FMN-containing flavoprotein (pyridoxamine 5'-phosphate oxidase superfamily)